MEKVWASDQISQILNIQGTAIAGIGGAPTLPRATEVRGLIKVVHFTIEQATPNPMPGTAIGGGIALLDSFILALLKPTDRIYFGRIYTDDWGGTGLFLSVGKVDPNNSANTDADHYKSAFSITGSAAVTDLDLNMGEQVGDDPAGDSSVGNLPPGFGSDNIQVTATLTGTTIGTLGSINGFIFIVEEGN